MLLGVVEVKFETNASSTQVATLNTIQTLKAAVGLNQTLMESYT